ncbi:hypothetical protein G6F56_004154 [Rhizopus delemar]|nr:hypothetical protein G6F56_004154 [Rhizopus delemar]
MTDKKRKQPSFKRNFLEERLNEQKKIKLEVQTEPCDSYDYPNGPSWCNDCTNESDACSFIHLRAFHLDSENKLIFGPYFPSATGKDPLKSKTTTTFKPVPPNKKSKARLIKYLKPVLTKVFNEEEKSTRSNQADPIFRQFTPGVNHYCDNCLTTMFNRHFICASCAYEICPNCYCNRRWKRCHSVQHNQGMFLIFEKYTKDTKDKLMADLSEEESLSIETALYTKDVLATETTAIAGTFVNPDTTLYTKDALATETTTIAGTFVNPDTATVVTSVIENSLSSADPSNNCDHVVFQYEDLTLEKFQGAWEKSKPIVVKNSLMNSKLDWSPTYFEKNYGNEEIQVIDCKEETAHPTTVGEYFRAFASPNKRKAYAKKLGTTTVLKIKDWPPTENISNKFPEMYKDFMSTVPAPEYSTADGYFNLANRLPTECLPPDLGPKVFISYKNGMTNLHCDMADAVNIMHYSSRLPKKSLGAAKWHIFPSKSMEKLSTWLGKRHRKYLKDFHPVHGQKLFVGDEEIKLLQKETGIRPWTIYQNPGDAIFIPAGCPHQPECISYGTV